MKKKILSLLLAVLMLTSILPMSAISAYAATYAVMSVAQSGTNVTYGKGDVIQGSMIVAIALYVDGTQVLSGNTNKSYTVPYCLKYSSYSSSKVYLVNNCSYSGATCQKVGTCSKCGRSGGSKASHNYNQQGSVYSYATCTANKVVYKKCQWCTATSGTMTVANTALGHDYTNYRDGGEATAATCTTAATHYKMCSRCTTKSGTYSYGSALGHTYTVYQSVKTAETCTADRVDNYKCSRCTSTTTKTIANTKLSHSYTKQGSLVSNATIDSPAIYNKQCATCTATSGTMEVGNKLPAMKVSYTDPVTNKLVEFGESTNDGVAEAVGKLMKTPMQNENHIFTGWYIDKKVLDKNINHFEKFTNISARFFEIVPMAKDTRDEKNVTDYLTFELAGVQIRQDNTIELENGVTNGEVYGGLRFVASLSDDIMNNLNIIQYGFAVTSKENADINANGDENYVIKNKDKNVRLVNCMGKTDHRTFAGNYRLYTMVIDYEGKEALKDVEMVVRPYIAYRDNNGVNRIFYGSYRGTNTYGGLSTSYNQVLAL